MARLTLLLVAALACSEPSELPLAASAALEAQSSAPAVVAAAVGADSIRVTYTETFKRPTTASDTAFRITRDHLINSRWRDPVSTRFQLPPVLVVPPPPPPPPPPDTTPPPPAGDRIGYYVAPTGSSGNAGTKASPWTLASVLSGSKPVVAGDTVWMLGGTYVGTFTSQVNGTSAKQVVLRQYPGERATVNGSFVVFGSYVTFWGFEVMQSSPTGKPTALDVFAPGVRLINLVIHDAGRMGVGIWNQAPNAVLYGSIIYNNGTTANKDHGVYFNGNSGTKTVADNVVFNNWQYGLHGYSPVAGELQGIRIEGNAVFNNGSVGAYGHGPDIFVGDAAITNLIVRDNYTWSHNDGEFALRIGSGSGFTFTGNRFVGLIEMGSWTGKTESDNVFWSSSVPPTVGLYVFVRPNAYEAGRANVIVYNWANAGSVPVDLSSVLAVGDAYEVRNAQTFYAAPVQSGTYGGGSITLALPAVTPPALIGRSGNTPGTTGTKFHVFVVLRR